MPVRASTSKSLLRKLKKYNLTVAAYRKMQREQKNRCWFCGRPPKTRALHIDHNHATKKVRALLCFRCNKLVVGRHDKASARRLLTYMELFDG